MNSIDVGIINYNGGQNTIECIDSLLQQKNIKCRVFVIDNASTDNSLELLYKHSKNNDFSIIKSKLNLGYAGACNQLIKNMTNKILALVNMDLIFDENWAYNICQGFQKYPQASSMASLVLHQNENTINWAGTKLYKDLHPQSIYSGKAISEAPTTEEHAFLCYGAVMTFKKTELLDIGPFESDYFLFFEETEYFLRMELLDKITMLIPSAKVYHYRSLATKRFSLDKLFYSERNRILTAMQYLPLYYLPITFLYSIIRFSRMLQNKPTKSENSNKIIMPSAPTIGLTIVKAWILALSQFPKQMKKKKAFWLRTKYKTSKTLELIKEHLVDTSELSL